MTMGDPATRFFEIVEIGKKTTNVLANWLEIHWLTQCPWPTEITVGKGKEFAREVSDTLETNMVLNGRLLPVIIHKQTP